MSNDAKWTVGTGVTLLAVLLAALLTVFGLLSGRLDNIEDRLLSIEEHLRAAPAPALPDAPHQ